MRIAVISDLHVHHEDESPVESWLTSNTPPEPWTNNPLKALERLAASHTMPDVVVCAGDFANKGSARGMASAFDYVDRLSVIFSDAPVIITPGNHDLDTSDPLPSDIRGSLRPFMSRFPVSEASASEALWRDHFVALGAGGASFLVLDTTGKATDRASARRGVFDEMMRDSLRSYLSSCSLEPIRIAVLHHHPILHSVPGFDDTDILDRGDELMGILNDHSFSLVIHGHKHHARLAYSPSGSDGPAVLASGTLSAIPKGSLITLTKNLFHYVDFEPTANNGPPFRGRVNTWQFVHGDGWVPSSETSAKFPHNAGFGSRSSAAALARTISERVSNVVRWADLCNEIEELRYLVPDDLSRLIRHLEMRHSLDISFDKFGDPHSLAPLSRSR